MDISFKISRIKNGIAYGELSWPYMNLNSGAVSGPYGRKELPAGLYRLYRSKLLDQDGQPPYCDSLNKCWMQVIDPQFSTVRTDLGIHPDGNKLGTLGCIGLLDADTSSWYDAFYAMPKGGYISLEVIT